MRHFKRDRGFLTFAQQSDGRDYLRMAYALALSLKATQRDVSALSVVVTPGTVVPYRYRAVFDDVIDIPWMDEAQNAEWKLQNEWKAYHCTPYRETVKLDADMLFTSDIGPWWDIMAAQDVMMCANARTINDTPIPPTSKNPYRACFAANDLADVYSGFMYFRMSDVAQEFFVMAEAIFHNWQRFFETFLEAQTRPQEVSTDVVYALALKVLARDDCTSDGLSAPAFVHLKSRLQDWPGSVPEQWSDIVPAHVTPDCSVKVAHVKQHLPLHYHDKRFLTDAVIAAYEKHLGIA